MKTGDMVRHRCFDSRRVGRVARVFRWKPDFPGTAIHDMAEVEWPRPEGNCTHDVTYLEKVGGEPA